MIKINAENLKLMTTVKIPGYGQSEGFREFEILTREDLEEKIDDLNISDVFRDTFEMANSYMHSGTAYSYLDARNGKIFTSWLGSNTFNHPWDSFYEIWLCDLKSGDQKIDLDTPEDILSNDEEWAAWREFDGSLEEYL
ncbi:MAG TPA: hypothetical protein DCY00_02025, partial [Actinobacteria bacterium]|nr:hypothetical protein [Actinomycetota bacterium]